MFASNFSPSLGINLFVPFFFFLSPFAGRERGDNGRERIFIRRDTFIRTSGWILSRLLLSYSCF